MKKLSIVAIAATAAALGMAAPAPAQAAATHLAPALASPAVQSNVIDVQRRRGGRHWRGHRPRHGHWHRRNRDSWLALGIGSAIVGGMLAARNTPSYSYAQSAWDRCAAQFRSLRPDGTYTTFSGEQRLCPYLR